MARPTSGGVKLGFVAGPDGLYELRLCLAPESDQLFWEKWSRLTVADRARLEQQYPEMKEETNGNSLVFSRSGDFTSTRE